ncbi:hypothetical protein DL98DRAFT_597185 [Cadophora sp. DSE1049]|nr:hypothetical protein DL98DRAFT_597185 [Cadophora sp. DSE1049]
MATPTDIQTRADALYITLYGPTPNPASEEYKAASETMKEVDEKYPPETYAPLEIKEYTLKMDLDRIRYLYAGLPVYYQARYRHLLYHFFKPAEVDSESRLELGVRLEALREKTEKELNRVLKRKKALDEIADRLNILSPETRFPPPSSSTSANSSISPPISAFSSTSTPSLSTQDSPAANPIKTIIKQTRLKNRVPLGRGPSYAEIQSYKRREADLSRNMFQDHVAMYDGLWTGTGVRYL